AIYIKKSGEAVSVAWFASSVGLEVVIVIYGKSQEDAMFTKNAWVCIVGQVLVLAALRVYKPFGKREHLVIAAMLAVIAASIVLPFKNAVQMAAQAVNLYGGADQPIQLKAGRDRGALEIWALVLSGLGSGVWTAYCWYHFGFLGPAVGYLMYDAYSCYMIRECYKKARSARSSS